MWSILLVNIAVVAEAASLSGDWDDGVVTLLQTQHLLQKASSSFAIDKLNLTGLSAIGDAPEKPLIVGNRFQEARGRGGVKLNIDLAPSANKNVALVLLNFHKTGWEFGVRFLRIWNEQNNTGLLISSPGESPGSYIGSPLWNYAQNLSSHWNLMHGVSAPLVQKIIGSNDFRMLNWIRKPHSLIVSAYRYHMHSPDLWGKTVHSAHFSTNLFSEGDRVAYKKDNDLMFGACDHHCTYTQLLKSVAAVNETLAVTIEGLNMRATLNHMVDVTYAYLNDARVLHLSVDHLAKDFTGTMRCINAFLKGRDLKPGQLHAFDKLQRAKSDKDRHTTRGRYDNTFLEQALLSLPNWSSSFVAFSKVVSKLFERQADMYECPIP